jgi:TPR repeat protein
VTKKVVAVLKKWIFLLFALTVGAITLVAVFDRDGFSLRGLVGLAEKAGNALGDSWEGLDDYSLEGRLRYSIEQSEHGDVDAMLYLHKAYLKGLGCKHESSLALDYLKRAAATEDIEALLLLASVYEKGLKSQAPYGYFRFIENPDSAVAAKLYARVVSVAREKATGDDLKAKLFLAKAHDKGFHSLIEKDPLIGNKWYSEAFKLAKNSSSDDLAAQGILAKLYEYGNSAVPRNNAKALELYTLLSESGDYESTRKLAVAYQPGLMSFRSRLEVEKDIHKTIALVSDLAQRGDLDSQIRLADIYRFHDEVQDFDAALHWYKKAYLQDPSKDDIAAELSDYALGNEEYSKAFSLLVAAVSVSPHPNSYRQNSYAGRLIEIMSVNESHYIGDGDSDLRIWFFQQSEEFRREHRKGLVDALVGVTDYIEFADRGNEGRRRMVWKLIQLYESNDFEMSVNAATLESYEQKAALAKSKS